MRRLNARWRRNRKFSWTNCDYLLASSWGCPDVEGCDPNALLDAVCASRGGVNRNKRLACFRSCGSHSRRPKWSANPKWMGDIDTTEQILRETAQPANNESEKIVCGDPNATLSDFVGYGIVDAYAAVKRALGEKCGSGLSVRAASRDQITKNAAPNGN